MAHVNNSTQISKIPEETDSRKMIGKNNKLLKHSNTFDKASTRSKRKGTPELRRNQSSDHIAWEMKHKILDPEDIARYRIQKRGEISDVTLTTSVPKLTMTKFKSTSSLNQHLSTMSKHEEKIGGSFHREDKEGQMLKLLGSGLRAKSEAATVRFYDSGHHRPQGEVPFWNTRLTSKSYDESGLPLNILNSFDDKKADVKVDYLQSSSMTDCSTSTDDLEMHNFDVSIKTKKVQSVQQKPSDISVEIKSNMAVHHDHPVWKTKTDVPTDVDAVKKPAERRPFCAQKFIPHISRRTRGKQQYYMQCQRRTSSQPEAKCDQRPINPITTAVSMSNGLNMQPYDNSIQDDNLRRELKYEGNFKQSRADKQEMAGFLEEDLPTVTPIIWHHNVPSYQHWLSDGQHSHNVHQQVSASDIVNAEKFFGTLAHMTTSQLPQSRLLALLGEKKKQLLAEEKSKKVLGEGKLTDRTTESVGRAGLIYHPPDSNSAKAQDQSSRHKFVHNYVKELAYDSIQTNQKRVALRTVWPQIFSELVHTAVAEMWDTGAYMKRVMEEFERS